MRILILSDDHPDLELGGAGRIAHQSAQWLAERGHEVWFVAATADASRVSSHSAGQFHEIVAHVPRARMPLSRALYSWRGVREARHIARRVKPDVIHAHGIHRMWSFAVLRAVRPLTRRLVWTAHDVMSVSTTKVHQDQIPSGVGNIVLSWWSRHMVRHADVVLAVSDALARYLERVLLAPRVRTLHNAIDSESWRALPCTAGGGEADGNSTVLFSGRISGTKGVYAAIDAMRLVKVRRPDAVLILAGGPETSSSKAIVYAADPSLVRAVGQQSHALLKCLMQSCAVVLTPSTYLDPFPTVNLEAMALGIPVVGTKFGGTPELVVDGKTGFVIDPTNTTECADAIVTLLSDDVLRVRMGAAGRQRIIEHFGSELYTETLLNIYTG